MTTQQNSKNYDNTSLVYGKVPPQAIEIEESLLGVLLLESSKMIDVLQIIPNEDVFYKEQNKKIFGTMLSMYNRGYSIDILTVMEQMSKNGVLELVLCFIEYMADDGSFIGCAR